MFCCHKCFSVFVCFALEPTGVAFSRELEQGNTHTHNHLLLFWNSFGTTRVKGKNKEGKTNLDLLEQEIVSGSGICWDICKSAPHPR